MKENKYFSRKELADLLGFSTKTLTRKMEHKSYSKDIPPKRLIPPNIVAKILEDLRGPQ